MHVLCFGGQRYFRQVLDRGVPSGAQLDVTRARSTDSTVTKAPCIAVIRTATRAGRHTHGIGDALLPALVHRAFTRPLQFANVCDRCPQSVNEPALRSAGILQ